MEVVKSLVLSEHRLSINGSITCLRLPNREIFAKGPLCEVEEPHLPADDFACIPLLSHCPGQTVRTSADVDMAGNLELPEVYNCDIVVGGAAHERP